MSDGKEKVSVLPGCRRLTSKQVEELVEMAEERKNEYGVVRGWGEIAGYFKITSRQCRDYYFHNIDKSKKPMTKEEDIILLKGVEEYGSRWITISERCFEGRRSRTELKNRFNLLTRQLNRIGKKQQKVLQKQQRTLQTQMQNANDDFDPAYFDPANFDLDNFDPAYFDPAYFENSLSPQLLQDQIQNANDDFDPAYFDPANFDPAYFENPLSPQLLQDQIQNANVDLEDQIQNANVDLEDFSMFDGFSL